MRMATVYPAPGMKIVMPERQNAMLPETGAQVPLDDYWRARLRDGDVTDTPAAAAAAPDAPAEAPAKRSKA